MARRYITRKTLAALFAKSGNVCAFPGCNDELVTRRNLFIGQICHIEAANPSAPRFNPNSNDEERRSFENLVLFCYRHHKETDDASTFDVQSLKSMKQEHEAKHGQKPFKVNEAFLHRLESEMDAYWAAIATANRTAHVVPEFAIPIRVGTPASQQFAEVYKALERLGAILDTLWAMDGTLNDEIRDHLVSLAYNVAAYDAVPRYKNPFFHRNWELHALAVNNSRADLFIALKQAEVRFLEEYVKTHHSERNALERLEATKAELQAIAVSAGYVD